MFFSSSVQSIISCKTNYGMSDAKRPYRFNQTFFYESWDFIKISTQSLRAWLDMEMKRSFTTR